jgi:hypothetical protein
MTNQRQRLTEKRPPLSRHIAQVDLFLAGVTTELRLTQPVIHTVKTVYGTAAQDMVSGRWLAGG